LDQFQNYREILDNGHILPSLWDIEQEAQLLLW